MTLHVLRDDDGVTVGYHKYHSHDLTPINGCLLLSPALGKILEALPEAMARIAPKGRAIEILLQEADDGLVDCVMTGMDETGARQTGSLAALAEECGLCRIGFRKDALAPVVPQISLQTPKKTSGALTVELPAGAFLQPSEEGEAALVQAVMRGLSQVKLSKKDKIADLFSGCGTFAGKILERAYVHAVEGDFAMSEALITAAKGHGRFSAETRDLFKEPVTARELREYKAVVFDPPRSGAKEQAANLAKSQVPLVIGVSCNPATFARDARLLIQGGYSLKSVQLADQFTWSLHTEMVGVFVRNE